MATLEQLKPGARVRGLIPDEVVTIKGVSWVGDQAVDLVVQNGQGRLDQRLAYRADEATLELVSPGPSWTFDGSGELFRLASEAIRIRLAHLFDPYLAVFTSTVDPLPHQIQAVYGSMLPRQPLRFLLADDPGAGKTIMAGLLIKELRIRGEGERVLIVAPGSLVDQWQDELDEKFDLQFERLTREMFEASRTGNPFAEHPLLIARLDQLSRNPDIQEKLKAAPEWDLVVCDEAHRMSGSFFGGEVKLTQRYKLGQLLGQRTRNLLLMTATPHSGKEADFQIFLALLDADRFEGHYREGVHTPDCSDLMRRLVKEELCTFEGKPLFPERRAHTVAYKLSDLEAQLYAQVTSYVREEMNRAERLADAEKQRKLNVGFALQTLQRRLASSPEAIYQSLHRRRERLEAQLAENQLVARGASVPPAAPALTEQELEGLEDDDATEEEVEQAEEQALNQASAARNLPELSAEILRLKQLEALAQNVRASGADSKWRELSSILAAPEMFRTEGGRRKLVVFTEARDTLTYLAGKIRSLLGKPEAVVEIHGGVNREARRARVTAFMNDPSVLVLVANDAAGEGVNLQRAHLMVNYDLPWNPNRLEQRFGRIHRIGQTEVCHLWNLLAAQTREGEVYLRLLAKLEVEREALGDRVYNVLGDRLFEDKALRTLLIEAVQYGDDPNVRARLDEVVDKTLDREHLLKLLQDRSLAKDTLGPAQVKVLREEMERAHARRLQPHFIQAFFMEAFRRLGGQLNPRESGRFEITHVPTAIRDRDRQTGRGEPVQPRYERICFERKYVEAQPRAAFICPGHPLLDATLDVLLERDREVLRRGAVLVDESDPGDEPRVLFTLEHAVQDGRRTRAGGLQVVSQRLLFTEVDAAGRFRPSGAAPYLDYRPATAAERELLQPTLASPWLHAPLEDQALSFAIRELAPEHLGEVRGYRLPLIDKVQAEVESRLRKEIIHWDHRAEALKLQERAGKRTQLSSANAAARAEELGRRLESRRASLTLERSLSPQPPTVRAGALIVPRGLLLKLGDVEGPRPETSVLGRELVERLAMEAVITAERALGREPRDRSKERGLGYDIESRDPATGSLLFIEVKGREEQQDSATLTKNEILCAMNEPLQFRLAVVRIGSSGAQTPIYVCGYDYGQPGFEQTSATYPLVSLLSHGDKPR